jgi:hypothetical protein
MPEEAAVISTGSSRSIDKSIAGLRKDYEKLARECDKAVAVKNQPEITRLMSAKKAAHALWHEAVVAERHARRDAMKANGMRPGVGV